MKSRHMLVFKQVPEILVHDPRPRDDHLRAFHQVGTENGKPVGIVQRQRGDGAIFVRYVQVIPEQLCVNPYILPGLPDKSDRAGGTGGRQQLAESRVHRPWLRIVGSEQHVAVNRPDLRHVRILAAQRAGSKDHPGTVGIHDLPAHIPGHARRCHQHRMSAVQQRGISRQRADAVLAHHHRQFPGADPR